MKIKRSISLKLFTTKLKQRKIIALIEAYRKAVNFYLNNFNENSKLNKKTLALLQNTNLSERYKSNALKQALGIWKGCLKTKKKMPKFSGFPILDAKFVTIEKGLKSFDLIVKLSSLSRGNKLILPTKKTKVLNKWLENGKLIQGCELHHNKIIVWIEIDKEKYQEGRSIGIDLGMTKLITTNEGQFIGCDYSKCVEKILQCKKNSTNYKKALKQRDNYVNWCVNQLPWKDIGILAYENLKNIVKGKNGRRKYKGFRVKQQHWIVRKVITRILEKCQENRVRPVYVNPRNTSRTCPSCNNVDAFNRCNDKFDCLTCGYKQDADIVGATNILNKAMNWIGSLESPNSKSKISI